MTTEVAIPGRFPGCGYAKVSARDPSLPYDSTRCSNRDNITGEAGGEVGARERNQEMAGAIFELAHPLPFGHWIGTELSPCIRMTMPRWRLSNRRHDLPS